LLWIRDNEPTVERSINFILDSKEYIGYKLGNRVTNDGLFFTLESKEMKKLNKEFHIPKEWFGKPHGYSEVAMHVTRKASRETGLKEDTPIVIGSSDSFSSIAGSGSIDEGIAVDTAGTTEVISITTGREMPSTIFSHFKPGFWFTFTSPPLGLAHQWYANLLESLKIINKKTNPYDFINNEAGKSPLGSQGLIFIPTLKQEYRGPPISGGFFGVSVDHKIEHFSRAVLEGISFRLREILENSETNSVPIKQIRLGGGGAKSDLWNQMRADIIGKDFAVLKVLESTSLGVALLTGIGIGIYSDLDDATYNMVRVSKILRPNKEKHDKYTKLYSIYRKINSFNKKFSSEFMNFH
jgi:xylulokinase